MINIGLNRDRKSLILESIDIYNELSKYEHCCYRIGGAEYMKIQAEKINLGDRVISFVVDCYKTENIDLIDDRDFISEYNKVFTEGFDKLLTVVYNILDAEDDMNKPF